MGQTDGRATGLTLGQMMSAFFHASRLMGVLSWYRLIHNTMASPESCVDAKKYVRVLEEELLPFAAVTHGVDWVFQQHNTPLHNAIYIRRFFLLMVSVFLSGPHVVPT